MMIVMAAENAYRVVILARCVNKLNNQWLTIREVTESLPEIMLSIQLN